MRPSADNALSVTFWGVRGSVPVAGPEYVATGGNSACIEIRCGAHVLLFDAGTGIRKAGIALLREGVKEFNIFLSHSHYDHVIGLPFFAPMFDREVRCTFWSGHAPGVITTRGVVEELLRAPFFPAGAGMFRAGAVYKDFNAGDILRPAAGIAIETARLDHPGGVVGYRVEYGGNAVAYLTDTGTRSEEANAAALRLAKNAEMVIYDCQYTEEEALLRMEFGHSTWKQGADLCRAAKARRLALFHHAPDRDDAEVNVLEAAAHAEFAGAFAAREGLQFTFSGIGQEVAVSPS
jgi:phosphoribosyl 1,2-cyclic phosphodiesterase